MLEFLWVLFSEFFLHFLTAHHKKPPQKTKTDADTQSSITHLPLHTSVSRGDARRGGIINSTATEAQNHIHSDCRRLLLSAFGEFMMSVVIVEISLLCRFSRISRQGPRRRRRCAFDGNQEGRVGFALRGAGRTSGTAGRR